MNENKKSIQKFNFCFSSFLYNKLQCPKDKTQVFDTRDTLSYAQTYIKGSFNLSNEKIQDHLHRNAQIQDLSYMGASDISAMLSNEEAKRFTQRKRCYCFLVVSENGFSRNFVHEMRRIASIDEHEDYFTVTEEDIQELLYRTLEDSEERDSIRNGLELFKILKKDRVSELFILVEGGANFFGKYPYMNMIRHANPTSLVDLGSGRCCTVMNTNDLPHDILEGRLFLGSYNQSEQYDLVMNLKITHILNITFECGNIHEDKGVKYLKISILDEPDKNIHQFFREAYEFINEALSEDQNNKVLIHCALGRSRSATITIMYLMKKFSWSYEKAFAFVKRKRDVICPNDGFIQKLQEFEKNQLLFFA